MKFTPHSDIGLGVFVTLFSIAFLTQTAGMPEAAAIFPRVMLIVLLCFGIGICVTGVQKSLKPNPEDPTASFRAIKYPAAIFGLMLLYALGMAYIGFFVSTGAFILAVMAFFRYKNIKVMLGTTAGLLIFLYLLFGLWLNVYMPDGLLF